MGDPTYIFEDGKVYTMVDGRVVASVKEAEFDPTAQGGPPQGGHQIPGEVQMPEAPADLQGIPCPGCGQPTEPQDAFCPSCGTSLQGEGGGPEFAEQMGGPASDMSPDEYGGVGRAPMSGQAIAQTVTTPNGLKGRVLARVPSLWGEEVTVRFENGVIKKIPVDQRLTFAAAESAPEGETSAQRLEERLATNFQSDKMSLVARGRELEKIKNEAASSVGVASDAEAVELSKIATQAGYEQREVEAALEAIAAGEVEAYEAPAPIENLPAVTQASTGSSDASWLNQVHNDMVTEANAVDYKKLMDEGPEQFVASLSPAQIADAAVTRVMASREIEAKVAGADETQREAYSRMWLARVENQRKAHLASHKEEVRKEAASDEPSHPDESLFL